MGKVKHQAVKLNSQMVAEVRMRVRVCNSGISFGLDSCLHEFLERKQVGEDWCCLVKTQL